MKQVQDITSVKIHNNLNEIITRWWSPSTGSSGVPVPDVRPDQQVIILSLRL